MLELIVVACVLTGGPDNEMACNTIKQDVESCVGIVEHIKAQPGVMIVEISCVKKKPTLTT